MVQRSKLLKIFGKHLAPMGSLTLFAIAHLCAVDGTMCFEQHSRVPKSTISEFDGDTNDKVYNIRVCQLFYYPIEQKNQARLKLLKLERTYCQYERYGPNCTVRYDLVTGQVTARLDTIDK